MKGCNVFNTIMFANLLGRFVTDCHQTSKDKGFWDGDNDNLPTKVALMHSELSELLEAFRKGNPVCDKPVFINYSAEDTESVAGGEGCRHLTAIEEEVADLFIRLCDFCGRYNIDLGKVAIAKADYNKTRPHKHGGKRC